MMMPISQNSSSLPIVQQSGIPMDIQYNPYPINGTFHPNVAFGNNVPNLQNSIEIQNGISGFPLSHGQAGAPMQGGNRQHHARQRAARRSQPVHAATKWAGSYEEEDYAGQMYQHDTGALQIDDIQSTTQALRASGSYAIPTVMTPMEQPSVMMTERGYPVYHALPNTSYDAYPSAHASYDSGSSSDYDNAISQMRAGRSPLQESEPPEPPLVPSGPKPGNLEDAASLYINHLVAENKRITKISDVDVPPTPVDWSREIYAQEALNSIAKFPTEKFRAFLAHYNIEIEVNYEQMQAHDEGTSTTQSLPPPTALWEKNAGSQSTRKATHVRQIMSQLESANQTSSHCKKRKTNPLDAPSAFT